MAVDFVMHPWMHYAAAACRVRLSDDAPSIVITHCARPRGRE